MRAGQRRRLSTDGGNGTSRRMAPYGAPGHPARSFDFPGAPSRQVTGKGINYSYRTLQQGYKPSPASR
jgi:hypothetical protein